MTNSRVVATWLVAGQRFKANCCIVIAGGIALVCASTNGCIRGAACVTNERVTPDSYVIGSGRGSIQSVITQERVVVAVASFSTNGSRIWRKRKVGAGKERDEESTVSPSRQTREISFR